MALTKVHWYFGVILIVATLFTSLLIFGNDMANRSDNILDADSSVYISQYAMHLNNSKFDTVAETDLVAIKNDSILGSEEGAPSITDVLATLNFYKSKIQKIVNTLQLVYNLPTLLVLTLGIPIAEVNHIINVIGWLLFAAMLITIIKLVRGS